ncbi:Chromo domain [Brachionus plicatilis]|uniref:Chromo domain n=1 Tax=Brachionus plicatilis TaxID=10195 RepID=A0A3M7Q4C2_BRAPC|nr:Chromo domain [Brachionus plicatilis]
MTHELFYLHKFGKRGKKKLQKKNLAKYSLIPSAAPFHLVSIFDISYLKFGSIKFYINNNYFILSELTNFFRTFNGLSYYSGQDIDLLQSDILQKWNAYQAVSLRTTGDGNCLYNAISLSIFGNEDWSLDIKLCMIFILIENENYFRDLIKKFRYEESFERLVEDSATIDEYGTEFNIMALSLLFLRPIKCYSLSNLALNSDISKLGGYPIFLTLKSQHFTPIIPINYNFHINETNTDLV